VSKAWIRAKLPEFVRDMFRNFCLSSKALEEQFRSFDHEGSVAFTILRDLIGQEMDKGLLWRMKDTAHHVFRNDPETPLTGQFLDWGLGYIFHETIKLKEDAYQALTYAPWFLALRGRDLPEAERVVVEELFQVLRQTEESMRREIDRIRFIMSQSRQLLFHLSCPPQGERTSGALPVLAKMPWCGRSSVRTTTTSSAPCTATTRSKCSCWPHKVCV
jgi:hypothetical protein